jgi:FkbM family methyltransferase
MNTKLFRGKEIKYKRRPDFWENLEGWEEETIDLLDKYMGPGKTLLDIGAWNGIVSVYAHLLGSDVYAVEPDVNAFMELEENFELNDISLFHSSHMAVSDKNGSVTLLNESGGFGNSMSSVMKRKGKETGVTVNATTLSDIVEFWDIKPDFIKMDTEGSELLIIPSSIDILKKLSCPLYLSLHPMWYPNPKEDMQKIEEALSEIYDLRKAVPMIHDQILLT